MITVAEIRAELHRRAQQLIPERYDSFDELLNVALENQLVLEEGRTESPEDPKESATEDEQILVRPEKLWEQVRILDAATLSPLPPPNPEQWTFPVLWGQVNRLLPVAAGIRVLGNLLAEAESETIPLGDWQGAATHVASELRNHLAVLDRRHGHKRGDLWSTGFPRDDSGSLRRYAGQFLARGSKANPGAAEALGLVVIGRKDSDKTAGISTAGVAWASLPNPVFDSVDAPTTFSDAEVRRYFDILSTQLPEERRFMETVAALIEGTESRTQLETALAERYPEWQKIIGTMRAGAIGRLHDLGLLTRVRTGTSVEYGLSERAREIGLSNGR